MSSSSFSFFSKLSELFFVSIAFILLFVASSFSFFSVLIFNFFDSWSAANAFSNDSLELLLFSTIFV
jgi:hypothetical protein